MKRNAIIRIILFSIALAVLLGILGIGIAASLFVIDTSSFAEKGDPDGYSSISMTPVPLMESEDTVSTTLSADDIHDIDIEWAAGNIIIFPQLDSDQITITEPRQTQDKYQMNCIQKGSTLKIEFWQDTVGFHSTDISKELTILVPADWICHSLEIETGAAGIYVTDLTIREVEIDAASGVCHFENCTVTQFDIDTASGDVYFTGSLDRMDFDAASASCQLTLNNVPQQIDLDSMTLPEDAGFSLEMDALSGDFSSNFETKLQNGRYICGDGSCRITISALSGDVSIQKTTAK